MSKFHAIFKLKIVEASAPACPADFVLLAKDIKDFQLSFNRHSTKIQQSFDSHSTDIHQTFNTKTLINLCHDSFTILNIVGGMTVECLLNDCCMTIE
jgi:hypothetical protein